MAQVKPGSIVLMHNGTQETIRELPHLLDTLKSSGFVPVTLSELFEK